MNSALWVNCNVHVYSIVILDCKSTFSTIVHLLINIQPCLTDGLDKCFDSAKFAAEFIVAAIQGNQWSTTLPIVDVECKFSIHL